MTEDDMEIESPKEKVTHGTLYVMRERDYLSGQELEYYKIGIVRGAKDVDDRLKDHLTGNPRDIFTVREFTSLAVQKLETLLHNLYAANRVHSGEWFTFNRSEAEDLLQEIPKWQLHIDSKYLELEGKKLPKGPGSDAIIPPDADTSELAQNLAIALAEAKIAKANKALVSKKLVDIAGENPDFATMFKSGTSTSGGSFTSGVLSKKDKALWQSFMTLITPTITPKWTITSPEGFTPSTSKIDKNSLTDNPVELHALFLEAWGEEYRWKLEADLLEDVILVRATHAAGIDGIFTWESGESKGFDKEGFKAKHPDMYEACTPPKVTTTKPIPAEWKSYV
jgi:hypothetical protein